MEEKTKIKKEKNTTKIKQITGTPFWYQQIEEKKFITCGKVKLDIKEDICDKEKFNNFKNKNLWDLIGLLCQAISYEIINNNNNNK